MGASIRDVATRAGVSVATVSRALRGLPNVAPSTRARVLDVAAELEYVAHPHAERLSTGRSRTIGVVAPQLSQWFFTQVVAGAEAVLTAAGYDVMLYTMTGTTSREHFFRDQPFRRRVDGLLLIQLPVSEQERVALEALELPVALVGVGSPATSTVTIDNLAAARAATQHLINLGHERIGLIAGRSPEAAQDAQAADRREGYQRTLRGAELPVHPELDAVGNFSMGGGAEAMAQLLTREVVPTAVFVESDEMAIGALKTIRDAGLRVPEDVSVVGFDDHEIAEFLGLTTVRQPVEEQGSAAADLLLRRLDGVESVPSVVLPTQLVVRRTTAPPRPAGSAAGGAALDAE